MELSLSTVNDEWPLSGTDIDDAAVIAGAKPSIHICGRRVRQQALVAGLLPLCIMVLVAAVQRHYVTDAGPPQQHQPQLPSVGIDAGFSDAISSRPSLLVDTAQLAQWIGSYAVGHGGRGGLLLLDAREDAAEHIVNSSCAVPWKSLSRWAAGGANKSVLLPANELQQRFRSCGLQSAELGGLVVIYGDWDVAWGEEGRLLWSLEYVTQPTQYSGSRYFILRGGFTAFATQFPELVSSGTAPAQAAADLSGGGAVPASALFVAVEQPARRLLKSDVIDGVSQAHRTWLLDSREPAEYTGAIDPYGVARAGHIAGAVSFPWKTAFRRTESAGGGGGRGLAVDLLPCEDIRLMVTRALGAAGGGDHSQHSAESVLRGQTIGTYCTGGIRSGFLYFVLRECFTGAELQAANYDGSMWQWAADPTAPMVLGVNATGS